MVNFGFDFIPNTIREVSIAVLTWRSALREGDRETRSEVADFFDNISNCIAEVTAKLRDDEIPHDKCGEMASYARQLPQKVGGVIKDSAEVGRLSELLAQAYNVESLWDVFRNLPNREEELAKLDEASGNFRGLAASVRPAVFPR